MLNLFRRHLKACPYSSRRYRRCRCPIWVEGSLRGEKVRRSLDLTSWAAASDLIAQWNAAGEIGVVKPEVPTIKEAVTKFLDDARARHLGWESMRKYENLLERRCLPWCEANGYGKLKQLDVDALRRFRATWEDGASYATKNLERLRAFFRFCHQAGWIKTNPAMALKPQKATAKPTLPFSRDEMKRILAACDRYRGNKERIKAFILVMRYSGLRIGDTITLKRDQLKGKDLFLYTQKTGQPVYVPVPDFVVAALKKIEKGTEHFFWTGKNLRSAVANWSRYLARVFELADVKNAHSHRFRDTFATELLLAGVPLEDVSILLGHSNTRITWHHYAPWVRERQLKLEDSVKRAWTLEGRTA
jgi:integrase